MKTKQILLTLIALMMTQIALSAEKQATCEIKNNNETLFKGICLFLPEHGGIFSLSALDKSKPLYDDILVVSVVPIKRNIAEVRGLTAQGNNSRWGEAKRSIKDKACWIGSDFSICAR